MRFALFVLLTLVAVVALATLWGTRLPVGHVATRALTLNQRPLAVWAVLSDFGEQATWRTDLKEVRRLAGAAKETWIEIGGNGEMPLETSESDPPRRLVRTIADPTLPFGGKWIYVLTPDGEGTRLTITEEGKVYNPLFRFVSHYLINPAGTVEGVMKDLAAHFNEAPRIGAP